MLQTPNWFSKSPVLLHLQEAIQMGSQSSWPMLNDKLTQIFILFKLGRFLFPFLATTASRWNLIKVLILVIVVAIHAIHQLLLTLGKKLQKIGILDTITMVITVVIVIFAPFYKLGKWVLMRVSKSLSEALGIMFKFSIILKWLGLDHWLQDLKIEKNERK